ncbi:MAG: hypothetical protein ACK47M_17415, partial [Caldilinea sp.]
MADQYRTLALHRISTRAAHRRRAKWVRWSVTPMLVLAAFLLTACDAQPTVSLRRDAQVAAAVIQS